MADGHLLRILRYGLGTALIVGGIIGLFLPFLQGIIMILVGVLLLKAESFAHFFSRIRDKFKKKSKHKKRGSLQMLLDLIS